MSDYLLPLFALVLMPAAPGVVVEAVGTERQVAVNAVERGPNHSVIQRVGQVVGPAGDLLTVTNSWTQLEDGLNYFDGDTQSWSESREELEITATGAIGRRGQHVATFSSNVNDPTGALDMLINGTVRLRCSVLALRYYDPVSGGAEIVATVQDTRGELLPPNQIVYRNAFDNLKADVLYTYRKSGVEADVILREVPPSPDEFGLPPEVARLEVVTEFFAPPEPAKRVRALAETDDAAVRAAVAEPDWLDEELDFGPNRIAMGRAFAWSAREAAAASPEDFPPVGKRWVREKGGQTFLIEAVEYVSLFDDLLPLPGTEARKAELSERAKAWSGLSKSQRKQAWLSQRAAVARERVPNPPVFPARRLASKAPDGNGTVQLASVGIPAEPGVVLDWTSISTGTANMTFRGDETYLVTGNCFFSGTSVLEGGAVVKFPHYTGTSTAVTFYNGTYQLKTSAYRPAVFTAEDDNSIGERITEGVPNLDTYYGLVQLRFYELGAQVSAEHLRFKYGYIGLKFEGNLTSSDIWVKNCQFYKCRYPISNFTNNTTRLQNVLIEGTPFSGCMLGVVGGAVKGENITVHAAASLLSSQATGITLTNSLIVGVTNLPGIIAGSNNLILTNDPGVFQVVGGGACYLPAGSPYRNAGTPNLNASLIADLKRTTTWAPMVLSGTINLATTLSPQAQPDTDLPDLGYHYPVLDYAFSNLIITNATLSLAEGVSLGAYGGTGILLCNGAAMIGEGSPLRPVRLHRYNCVQEGAPSEWAGTNTSFDLVSSCSPTATGATVPTLDLRFAELGHLANGTATTTARRFVAAGGSTPMQRVSLTHCQLRGLHLDLAPPPSGAGNLTVALNNCNFELTSLSISDSSGGSTIGLSAYNDLFNGAALTLQNSDSGTWTIKDNLIAASTVTASGTLTAANNGFRSGVTGFGSNQKTGLTLDFVSGPLGSLYYPTSGGSTSLNTLFDAGSRTSAAAGLYHFTTKAASNGKEGTESNTAVDIGFHYAGVDLAGKPADTDGDGIPDCMEDHNGSGTWDTGETDWQNSSGGAAGALWMMIYTQMRP